MRGCLRWPAWGVGSVSVLYSAEKKAACYGGLQTCGSVWLCPVCSAKISERRRLELAAGLAAWSGSIALVTYTVRHKQADSLARSLEGLLRARRAARTCRASQALKARHGIAGTVRALEVTHGANGWHPHLHELVFLLGRQSATHGLGLELQQLWASMQGRAGLRDVNEHGVKVQLADQAVADYVAKFGHERTWDESHELAKAVVKRGRGASRTPADLLAAYMVDHDAGAGALWQEYARTFKGRRQLAWSRGMRDLVLPGQPEESDEQVSADTSSFAELLASLTLEQWRVVVGNDCRAEVLQIAARGDREALWLFLRALGC